MINSRLKKIGVAGFAFFAVKGMLWLALPAIIVFYKGCAGVE
jgi:hypothetical protein